MYERGDVVLLPLPFTDLSATQTRPAVVVSVNAFAQATGDFTVAMITSVPHTLYPGGKGTRNVPRSIR